MKRKVICMFAMCMLMFTACGKEKVTQESVSETVAEEQEVESKEEKEEKAGNKATVMQENLKDFPVTDESCFSARPVEGGLEIDGYKGNDLVVVVPEIIGGEPVVGIGTYGISNAEMEGIVLPDTVTYIGTAAFLNDMNLKYIDLGSGLKKIEDKVFTSCSSLKQVIFPDGMETVGSRPFNRNDSIEEIYVPESVVNIGESGIVNMETCPNAVIVTPAGSAAETAAKENGIPVKNP